ncbi:peptidase U32, partial [Candidatus Marinamargulisbacteria bacterium SCGC AG-439-L15]
PKYLETLNELSPHALIISDLGVLKQATTHTNIPIHISTQASITNWQTALFWKNAGAKRLVLARELSLSEAKIIQEKAGIEIEVFIHGAMCASYSGKCTISNYTAGRDSNRGGCIQSCRHNYTIIDPDTHKSDYSTHIMNAKDLNTLALIPQLCHEGVTAFKIEGRMKSNHYLANAVALYRDQIDRYYDTAKVPLSQTSIQEKSHPLSWVSNRGFSSGGLENRPDENSISFDWNGYNKKVHFIGTIKEQLKDGRTYAHIKAPFTKEDTLLIQNNKGDYQPFTFSKLCDLDGTPIGTSNPNRVVVFHTPKTVDPYSILVKGIKT